MNFIYNTKDILALINTKEGFNPYKYYINPTKRKITHQNSKISLINIQKKKEKDNKQPLQKKKRKMRKSSQTPPNSNIALSSMLL